MSWTANKQRKREEREARLLAESEEREREEKRKAALTMWERIEEADASADVKEILHMMAQKLGMED